MSSEELSKQIKMQDIESSIRAFDNITKNRFRQQKNQYKYKIDEFNVYTTLGTGTFGKVRLVKYRDRSDNKSYALKMLKKKDMIKLKQVDHVKSEKRLLERINHPFIIQLKNTFQDRHYVYMLLEYAAGGELFSRLRKEGRFSNDVGLFYATEILLAFQYMHSSDIIYRDLKPENLLIDKEGHIKLTDFGFAKVVRDKTYTLCGTPEYLAPEIIKNKGHNKLADWWAFGILIFEMLAGYPPFYDDNPMGIYKKIVDGYYEMPVIIRPEARELIQKFLVADPSKRLGYNDSTEVKEQKWFRGVDWNIVNARKIPVPWVPQLTSDIDSQFFDPVNEKDERPITPEIEEERLFNDF